MQYGLRGRNRLTPDDALGSSALVKLSFGSVTLNEPIKGKTTRAEKVMANCITISSNGQ
jgi:hypothetical protein